MPIESLLSISPGSAVFIDANIFIYGFNHLSVECETFLERCKHEEFLGVTLFEVIAEATHTFMMAEALSKRVIHKPAARFLRERADLIPTLHDYWRQTERILGLELLFLNTSETIIRRAQVERQAYGLLTNDSLIVATMRHYGIRQIAPHDEDFGNISGITLFRPDDI